ncbi:MAG: M48 family metallopeptidase [Bacillota bacterium]
MNKIILDNYLINYQVFFKNIKHMYLRIENGQINISCNKKTKIRTIEAFLRKKKDWILARIKAEPIVLYNKDKMYLWGDLYPVTIDINQRNHIDFNKKYFILNKEKLNINQIEKFYKKLTIEKTKELLEDKIIINNFNIDDLIIKSQLMKTRLGSCNMNKNIIKLNSLLSRFSVKYLKMVFFHELVHLNINNHSKSFYRQLNKFYPNYKKDNEQLKKLLKNIHY